MKLPTTNHYQYTLLPCAPKCQHRHRDMCEQLIFFSFWHTTTSSLLCAHSISGSVHKVPSSSSSLLSSSSVLRDDFWRFSVDVKFSVHWGVFMELWVAKMLRHRCHPTWHGGGHPPTHFGLSFCNTHETKLARLRCICKGVVWVCISKCVSVVVFVFKCFYSCRTVVHSIEERWASAAAQRMDRIFGVSFRRNWRVWRRLMMKLEGRRTTTIWTQTVEWVFTRTWRMRARWSIAFGFWMGMVVVGGLDVGLNMFIGNMFMCVCLCVCARKFMESGKSRYCLGSGS